MTNSALYCPVSGLRNILLATDGSQYSEGAVREAIRLAKQCSATLYAISVIEVVTDYEGLSIQRFEEMQEAEVGKLLGAVKDAASKEGVICETVIAHGDPHSSIVEEAEKKRADLIVIGRRGLKGIAKALMGAVAARVIGAAQCNVLVVPRAAKIEFRTVLVATDGSTHSNAAASAAIALSKQCGSRLIALSAMRNESERATAQEHVNKVVEQGKLEGVAVEPLTPLGRSYDAIVETAGGRGADLIVMGAYGKTGLKKFLMGSSTEKVIGSAGCAVLVVKAKSQ
jgi:nucleotide-binding universal stress UspA family protein